MAADPRLVIGLDASTSACKAVTWDLSGRPVQEGRSGLEIQQPQPGWHEQDPAAWWSAACIALRAAAENQPPTRLLALAIAHQRESFVAVDAACRPLRPALLWLDQRAAPLLGELTTRLDPQAFHQRTGKPLSANLAPGKLAWLRQQEPDLFSAAHCFLDTHAYLVYQLCGEWVTSSGSADPLGLFDLSKNTWDRETLACLGIPLEKLPRVAAPGEIIGHLTHAAAAQTGLPAGLPIVAGLGDGQAGSLGSGLAQPDEASISLGTSVIGGCLSHTMLTSPAFRTMAGASQGSYILETVLLGGSYTIQWLLHDLLRCEDLTAARAELETAAAELTPGAQGLLLLPYWNGAMNPYWDPSAAGTLIGLRGIHRREHLFRAILEGVAFEVRLHLEGVEKALSAPIRRLLVSGGGARSPLWRAILASVCDRPVYHATTPETAALGAGILAAVGAGAYPDLAAATRQMVQTATNVDLPQVEDRLRYAALYSTVYQQLYPALRQPFAALANLNR